MVLKYRFNLKDIKLEDFKVYLLAMFKSILPKKKINNLDDLEDFIQKKSAWVTQVTLYGYLKTRMGTKYVLHFDNEKFLGSINNDILLTLLFKYYKKFSRKWTRKKNLSFYFRKRKAKWDARGSN